MKKYVYSGDIKLLKTIGFKFDKPYGGGRKSYSRDDITMFVSSKLAIRINHVKEENRRKYIDYILKNKNKPKEFWVRDEDLTMNPNKPVSFKDAPIWFLSERGNVVSSEAYYDKKYELHVDIKNLREKYDNNLISLEDKDIEFDKIREKEFYFDAIYFDLKTVQLIIELDNLHKLELKDF